MSFFSASVSLSFSVCFSFYICLKTVYFSLLPFASLLLCLLLCLSLPSVCLSPLLPVCLSFPFCLFAVCLLLWLFLLPFICLSRSNSPLSLWTLWNCRYVFSCTKNDFLSSLITSLSLPLLPSLYIFKDMPYKPDNSKNVLSYYLLILMCSVLILRYYLWINTRINIIFTDVNLLQLPDFQRNYGGEREIHQGQGYLIKWYHHYMLRTDTMYSILYEKTGFISC